MSLAGISPFNVLRIHYYIHRIRCSSLVVYRGEKTRCVASQCYGTSALCAPPDTGGQRAAICSFETSSDPGSSGSGRSGWPGTRHDLRHSCLTNWAQELPVHVVRKLAGHSDIKTTQKHYMIIRQEDMEGTRLVNTGILGVALVTISPPPKKPAVRAYLQHDRHGQATIPCRAAEATGRNPATDSLSVGLSPVLVAPSSSGNSRGHRENGQRYRTCDLPQSVIGLARWI